MYSIEKNEMPNMTLTLPESKTIFNVPVPVSFNVYVLTSHFVSMDPFHLESLNGCPDSISIKVNLDDAITEFMRRIISAKLDRTTSDRVPDNEITKEENIELSEDNIRKEIIDILSNKTEKVFPITRFITFKPTENGDEEYICISCRQLYMELPTGMQIEIQNEDK